MNDLTPESQAKIEALVQWIADNAVKGGEFVKEQAPDVAREIVAWGLGGAIFGIAMSLVVLAAFAIAARLLWRAGDAEYVKRYGKGYAEFNYHFVQSDYAAVVAALDKVGYDGGRGRWRIGAWACFTVGCSVFLLIASINVYTVVRVTVAPKVYLLEQLRVLK